MKDGYAYQQHNQQQHHQQRRTYLYGYNTFCLRVNELQSQILEPHETPISQPQYMKGDAPSIYALRWKVNSVTSFSCPTIVYGFYYRQSIPVRRTKETIWSNILCQKTSTSLSRAIQHSQAQRHLYLHNLITTPPPAQNVSLRTL